MIASLLIEFGWKSALVCSVALLASQALRGRPAAQRVAMLRAGVAALLLLPLLVFTVPVLEIAVLPATEPLPALDGAALAALPAVTASAAAPEIDWLALAYGAGAAFVLLRVGIGLFVLRRWTRLAVPASDPVWAEAIARAAEPLRRPVRLLVSPRIASPLSLGIAPATILIGPDTERCPARAAAVIAHEMAHVRALDWPAMLAARLALALFWFNPLAWLLAVELARQTELAADEQAVMHVGRADYAQALLAVAGACGAHGACGMAASRSTLARRIRRVLDTAPSKPASGLLCAALIGSIPMGIAPLAAMQLVPAPAPPVAPAFPVKPRQPAPLPVRTPMPEARVVQEVVETPKPRRVAPKRVPAAASRTAQPELAERVRTPALDETVEAKATRLAEAAVARSILRGGPPKPPAPTAKDLPVKTVWGAGPDVRGQVAQRMAAASQLRAQAQDYSKRARDESLSPDIRESYVKVADSLRDNAERLEKQARQMKRVF